MWDKTAEVCGNCLFWHGDCLGDEGKCIIADEGEVITGRLDNCVEFLLKDLKSLDIPWN